MEKIANELFVSDYQSQGHVFPLQVISAQQAATYLCDFNAMMQQLGDQRLGYKAQINQVHVVARFASEIVRNPAILDAVEAIIGPDILVWGSTFFLKPPQSKGFVSWHQDLRYWGLADSEALVSAWLALGPVNRDNGCMQFLPGSHAAGLVEHVDQFESDNILTRGQHARVAPDEEEIVHVELEAGQMSLHHGYLLHASAPNHSTQPRIGYNINFIAPHNRQVVAQTDYAMLVRGEDKHGHFTLVPPPEVDFDEAAMTWHKRILDALDETIYQGVKPT